MTLSSLFRVMAAVLGLALLAACDAKDLGEPPKPMGNFALGLNVVVPETAQTVPISRKATPEEWKAVMTQAIQDRFGSYTGDKLFDFGISIDGYVLAPPGVPIVASPKSALIITLTVWDDAKKQVLVEGGKRIITMEGVSPESIIGSGWTQSKDQQMKKLAANAAKSVQDYMLAHPEWLGLPADGAPVAAVDPKLPADDVPTAQVLTSLPARLPGPDGATVP